MTDLKPATFDELRNEVTALSNSLPKALDIFAVDTKFKAPGKVMMLRESIIWRAEELARNAACRLNEEDYVASALLTRAMMETTAAIVYLHKLVKRALDDGYSAELEEKLTGFLTGSKIWEDLKGAVNVLTMIDAVDKVVPSYRKNYDMLSEFAHPNWSGTLGGYATIDYKKATMNLGRGGRSPENMRNMICLALSGAVGLFTGYYNFLADQIEPFGEAVAKFYEDTA